MKEVPYSEQWFERKLARAAARKRFFTKTLWEEWVPSAIVGFVVAALFVVVSFGIVGGITAIIDHNAEIKSLQDKVRVLERSQWGLWISNPQSSTIWVTNTSGGSFKW